MILGKRPLTPLIALIWVSLLCSSALSLDSDKELANMVLDGQLKIAMERQPTVTGDDMSYLQIKYAAEEYFLDEDDRSLLQQSGEAVIPTKNIPDSGYTAIIGVGTPPQKLYCIMDTGSSIMYIK